MSAIGTKRKRSEPKFYAVKVGKKPGIYHSWPECFDQVKGFPNATFKSFTSFTDAEAFVKYGLASATRTGAPTKYYAVRSGRVPGIYTDWVAAKDQITGWPKPRYKAFPTRSEADAFLRGTGDDIEDTAADSVTPATVSSGAANDGDVRSGKSKGSGPPASKRKKLSLDHEAADLEIEPGEGPLPPGAIDGFDSNIVLNAKTGKIDYRTERQRNATKMQPVGTARGAELKIYTDGSAHSNGRVGAKAGYGIYLGPNDPRNVAAPLEGPRQTNQRAELTAILKALELAPRNKDIRIFTDSQYSIRCVEEWSASWIKNNWQTATRKQVENRDLIEQILHKKNERASLGSQTSFQWTKGHANDWGNIEADRLANEGAARAYRSA